MKRPSNDSFNLKTAKALGLTIPPSLLQRAWAEGEVRSMSTFVAAILSLVLLIGCATMSEDAWAPGATAADRAKCEQVADDKTAYNLSAQYLGFFYLLRRNTFKKAYKECMARKGYNVSPDRLVLPQAQQPTPRPAPTPPPPEPSLSAVPINVWKTAPIGAQGAMVRYQLIEKGSPLDTCTPPLVSVRIYDGGITCAPAQVLK
jgi:hypothetical protein